MIATYCPCICWKLFVIVLHHQQRLIQKTCRYIYIPTIVVIAQGPLGDPTVSFYGGIQTMVIWGFQLFWITPPSEKNYIVDSFNPMEHTILVKMRISQTDVNRTYFWNHQLKEPIFFQHIYLWNQTCPNTSTWRLAAHVFFLVFRCAGPAPLLEVGASRWIFQLLFTAQTATSATSPSPSSRRWEGIENLQQKPARLAENLLGSIFVLPFMAQHLRKRTKLVQNFRALKKHEVRVLVELVPRKILVIKICANMEKLFFSGNTLANIKS